MSIPNTDYDAAQALLDLQGTIKPESNGPFLWRPCDGRQEVEKTAKMFWNCFISTDVQALPMLNREQSVAQSQSPSKMEYTKVLSPIEVYANGKPKNKIITKRSTYRNVDSKNSKIVDTRSFAIPSRKPSLLETGYRNDKNNITREVATQTEEKYCHPNIEFMENTIKKLCERIQSLENQLKQPNMSEQNSDGISTENEDIDNRSYRSSFSIEENVSRKESTVDEPEIEQYTNYSKMVRYEDSDEKHLTNEQNQSEVLHKVITNHSSYTKSSNLVPIGDGHASVPARLLKHINWNSYTSATRKLLTAVFSRRILATHSLTGKPSPAFPNKPAKKKLDPALVNDIVQTVVERCSVPENMVRTSITTKCADESKMFKTRQNNSKKRRTSKKNSENIPPTTSESESDGY